MPRTDAAETGADAAGAQTYPEASGPIAAGLLLQLEAPPAADQEASRSLYLLASLVAGALAPGPSHGGESMARDRPDGSPLRG